MILSRVLELPYEIKLSTLAGGIAGSTQLLASQGPLVWATQTPLGLGSMSIALQGADGRTVAAQAYGDGAPWLIDQLPAVVGLLDDTSTFVAHHTVVEQQWRRGPIRFGATGRVFDALLPAVLGQKVQTVLAEQSLRMLTSKFGEVAPGPAALKAFPSAAVVAKLSFVEFHLAGVERRRAEVLLRAARVANRLEEGGTLGVEVAEKRLGSLPGIGPWTIAVTVGPALGNADAVPVGDAHLSDLIGWGLAGEPRATDQRMLELLESYSGHRGRLFSLLRRAGVSPPKYGPRLEAVPLSRFDRRSNQGNRRFGRPG